VKRQFCSIVQIMLAAATTVLPLRAQQVSYDRVLVPLKPNSAVLGAFGTEWETDLAVANTSENPVLVTGVGCGDFDPCVPTPLPPHASAFLTSIGGCDEVRGLFVQVEHGRLSDVSFTLRTRELTRQMETWGTSVPVVPTDRAFNQRFGLTDIPTDSQFRSILRIFSMDPGSAPATVVRFFKMPPLGTTAQTADPLLVEKTLALTVPTTGGATSACPGFTELPLSNIPELMGQSRIRIEVEPVSGSNYWAMASVTHNDTQQVTVITPN
jgi:hypothetical protein